MAVCLVYLKTGTGLTGCNAHLLGQGRSIKLLLNLTMLLVRDLNDTPEEMLASGELSESASRSRYGCSNSDNTP